MAFVRKSKFRHVFGQAAKKENCYEGFRVTNCAFEGTFIAANGKFIAFCVEVGGCGAFSVLPVERKGRLDVSLPKITAHKDYILDLQWSPYNDNMIATCSEDGSIKVWEIGDNGPATNWDGERALLTLEYHERRCVQIAWHPIASNVLLSLSQEPKMCIWNLDEGVAEVEIDPQTEVIWNAAWSQKGDKIVTSCKDKKFRIYNPRTGDLIIEGNGHEGSKAQRVIFTMNDKYLFSCGFSRMSERQYCCWNAETLEELNLAELDTANGCLIPYYDPDTEIVYIAAKGDSVIRYYELVDEEPYFHYITTFSSTNAQRGLAPIPKRSCNVNENEVTRFYKLTNKGNTGLIEPISMTVPRKSDIYQDDLYPDAISDVPALEPFEWFEGKDAEPNRIDMKTKFVGKMKKKTAGGGGLKKGGLKGLKAKKEKEAAKLDAVGDTEEAKGASSAEEPSKEETKEAESVEKVSASPARGSPAHGSPVVSRAATTSSVDLEVLYELKAEIKALKEKEKKRPDPKVIEELKTEVKALKDKDKKREQDVKTLIDKNVKDMKLLVDAMKKNDERIAALEALVQEDSDEEES